MGKMRIDPKRLRKAIANEPPNVDCGREIKSAADVVRGVQELLDGDKVGVKPAESPLKE